jgi:tetratricopeptide (TPR) repeat protein
MITVPAVDSPSNYTREGVCRLLGIRESVLESWEEHGFVARAEKYGFRDLVALKTLRELRAKRVRVERIRLILASLRAKLKGVHDPLSELKIYTDGRRLAVQVDGQRMEPLSGQLLLDFDREEIRRLLQFPGKRAEETIEQALVQKQREAAEWFEQGVELERTAAAPERIIEAYRKAIELDADAAGPHVNLGTLYFHLKRWPEAEASYRAAIALRSDYALAWFNLGNVYDELNNQGAAEECYLRVLEIDAGYADAHYNLALIHQSRGDNMQAVRCWRQYLKYDPAGYWAGIARRELSRLRQEAVVNGGA